jgi:hypothetical protein
MEIYQEQKQMMVVLQQYIKQDKNKHMKLQSMEHIALQTSQVVLMNTEQLLLGLVKVEQTINMVSFLILLDQTVMQQLPQ